MFTDSGKQQIEYAEIEVRMSRVCTGNVVDVDLYKKGLLPKVGCTEHPILVMHLRDV